VRPVSDGMLTLRGVCDPLIKGVVAFEDLGLVGGKKGLSKDHERKRSRPRE